MSTHWSTLIVVHNDAGVVYDETLRRSFLDELRLKGSMSEAYLTRTWTRNEDPKDRKTWGPIRRNIDWSGFSLDIAAPVTGRVATAEASDA